MMRLWIRKAETVEALRNLNTKQGKTIEALQKKLSITKTPETRLGDARKLTRHLLKEHSSRADLAQAHAEARRPDGAGRQV